jgi:PAS domain-containing protein
LKLSFFNKLLLVLALGLFATFVIDPLDPSTLSTPFLLGMILMGLSLRQTVSLVITSSLAYFVLAVIALVNFRSFYDQHIHVTPHPYFWLFQRLGLFLVVCSMAIYLSYYRTDTQRNIARFRTILSKLPAPVIISDGSGSVTYVNDAMRLLLAEPTSSIFGKSYFDFFLMQAEKGRSIRSYFELFEDDQDEVHEIEISLLGSSKKIKAQLTCLGTGQNRIMITVLQTTEKVPLASFMDAAAVRS